MTCYAAGVLVAVAAFLVLPPQAQAQTVQTLVSNTGQVFFNDFTASSSWVAAQRFTTGDDASGYALSSVEVFFSSGFESPDEARVSISGADASGNPGSSLYVLANPNSIPNTAQVNSFTAPPAARLDPGTDYFVVIEATAGAFWFQSTDSGAEDSGKASCWSILDTRHFTNADIPWRTGNGSLMIAVKSTGNYGTTPCTDATLSDLALTDNNGAGITLNESFASDLLTYTASAANTADQVTVMPTLSDANATIEYLDGDGAALTDADTGTDGFQVDLETGDNVTQVKVTSEDGNTTQTYTVTVTVPTPATVPGAPTSLTATANGERRVDLFWTAPADDGGSPITGYRLEISNSSDGSAWYFLDYTGNTVTSYSHTGSSPNVISYYRVLAINFVGTGAASNVDNATFQAQGQTLVSNTGQGPDGSWTVDASSGSVQAQGFTTGDDASGYTLSSVEVFFDGGFNHPSAMHEATVSIYGADASGNPGSSLHVLTNPQSVYLGAQVISFTAPTARLAPGTNYFVVVEAQVGLFTVSSTDSDAEDSGKASCWSIHDTHLYKSLNTTWTHSNASLRIAVMGGTGNYGTTPCTTTVPGAPTSLTATANGTSTINLTWDAPADNGGSAITGYRIEVSSDGGTGWTDREANTNSTTTSYSHTGLSPGTTHHYRVSAINANGTGAASSTGNATTTTVPGAPTGLTATASGTSTINLTWDAPSNDGGASITGYRIEVSPNGTSSWTEPVANTGTTSTSYSHTGLSAGTTRHYRVSAINSVGTGAASNVDNATTDAAATTVPGAPTSLTATASGTTTIDLSWTAPSDNGGSAITGYRIEVSPNGTSSWTNRVTNTGTTTTSYSHTGLSAGTTRHYRVSAINSVGTGTASNVDNATTDDAATTVPGAPTGLTATASGTSTINLTWDAPSNDGGASITGYRIEVSPNGTSSWTERVANTGTTTTSYSHTGLAPGTTRYYRVSAINAVSTGARSNIANATTQARTQALEIPADWSLKPDAVGAGERFRLLFVSSTGRTAAPGPVDIGDYNTHVQDAAAAGHADIRAFFDEFRVVGSTPTANVRLNTMTRADDTDVPIYWVSTTATRSAVADGYADFYGTTGATGVAWGDLDLKTETGASTTMPSDNGVHTGSNVDGTTSTAPLGGNLFGVVEQWYLSSVDDEIQENNNGHGTLERRLLGLSPIFVVGDGTSLSTDATLSALALSGVTLDEPFAPATEDYTAMVVNSVMETTVTATTTHSGATVAFKDGDDNALTNPVTLDVGDNVIEAVVTAEDLTAMKTYMVTVTRAGAGNYRDHRGRAREHRRRGRGPEIHPDAHGRHHGCADRDRHADPGPELADVNLPDPRGRIRRRRGHEGVDHRGRRLLVRSHHQRQPGRHGDRHGRRRRHGHRRGHLHRGPAHHHRLRPGRLHFPGGRPRRRRRNLCDRHPGRGLPAQAFVDVLYRH